MASPIQGPCPKCHAAIVFLETTWRIPWISCLFCGASWHPSVASTVAVLLADAERRATAGTGGRHRWAGVSPARRAALMKTVLEYRLTSLR